MTNKNHLYTTVIVVPRTRCQIRRIRIVTARSSWRYACWTLPLLAEAIVVSWCAGNGSRATPGATRKSARRCCASRPPNFSMTRASLESRDSMEMIRIRPLSEISRFDLIYSRLVWSLLTKFHTFILIFSCEMKWNEILLRIVYNYI